MPRIESGTPQIHSIILNKTRTVITCKTVIKIRFIKVDTVAALFTIDYPLQTFKVYFFTPLKILKIYLITLSNP